MLGYSSGAHCTDLQQVKKHIKKGDISAPQAASSEPLHIRKLEIINLLSQTLVIQYKCSGWH